MRSGYHSLTWGREGIRQAIEDISSLGYRGMEIFDSIAQDYDRRRTKFRDLLGEHNLALAGLYANGKLSTREDFAKGLDHCLRCGDFLSALGGEILILGGGLRHSGESVNESIKRMAESCNRIGERITEMGLRAAYHPHLGTLIENRDEIGLFIEFTEPGLVWLAPDTAHITAAGGDAVDVFRSYIERIAYVHLKDVNPRWLELRKSEPRPNVRVFSELGIGPVDFSTLVDVLKANNYIGWLMVELDETETSARESAEISKRYLEEELGITFGSSYTDLQN